MLRGQGSNNKGFKELDGLDQPTYLKRKRSMLFSQLCILAALAALIQGAYDLYDGFPYVMSIDVGFALILLLGHQLNKKGKYHLATVFIFTASNIILFVLASIVPKGVGVYLLYFPLIVFSFISYDYAHRRLSFAFAILSTLLNIILLLTNFQPFGNINLQPTDPTLSFALNMFISIGLLSMGINFLIRLNYNWEQVMLKNQEQTERLSKEVKNQNITLEKANQELDRFVYSTSHDLKAPLASIRGLINLTALEKEEIPPGLKDYLQMIKERVHSLDDFIKDIIDYSKNSRTEIDNEEIDIPSLIDEVFQNNRFLKNAEQVEIVTEIENSKAFSSDKQRLFRVLNNLVSNAIKYSDETKQKSYVKIKVYNDSNNLIIKIEDNGIGIEDHNKEKIFEMFFRGTETSEGSGLGLYIAQEMISKMGGSLNLESQFHQGSTFTIKLPIRIT